MNLKILLINNKQAPQLSLEKFLKKYGAVDTIHFQSISIFSILKTYIFKRPDLIVLSGAGEVPLNFSLELYKDELEMIKTANFPILGVCFGFEAIAVAYNEKLIMREKRLEGIYEIKMKNGERIKVWQSHRWYLEKTHTLEVLAESENGIEVVRVPNKNIYGVQFHPEHDHPENKGYIIIDEIMNVIFRHK